MMPLRTLPPVAVRPLRQYAVAEKLPRLAPAALTDPVVLTSLVTSSALSANVFIATTFLLFTKEVLEICEVLFEIVTCGSTANSGPDPVCVCA
jgi:hypothetical protein